MSQYLVKRAPLVSAARNPYKPRQALKCGRYVDMGKFDTFPEAWSRFAQLCNGVGLYKTAIYFKGQVVAAADDYGRPAITSRGLLIGLVKPT